VPRDADFQQIIDETEGGVRAYIAGLGVPLDTVDDIAQEAYLALYQQWDRLPDDLDMRRWLRGVARNMSMDYFKKARRKSERRLSVLAVELAEVESPVEQLACRREAHAQLQQCLERVQKRGREVLRLRYQEDMPSNRIGEKLGMSAQAVRVALHRVRLFLKQCLESSSLTENTGGA
jgi:RNA polymerase sigma-70 factor (ECF subfamily)